MSELTNFTLNKNVKDYDLSPRFDVYSRVTILVDDNTEISVGNDSGRELTIECPWGTQAMANNILNSLAGYEYQPFEAEGAILNPAAEIGDAVTLGGVMCGLYSRSETFGKLMASKIASPSGEDINHEYPYEPVQDKKIRRQFGNIETQLLVQNGLISAEVSERESQYSSLSAQLAVQSSQIDAKVSQVGGSSSSFGWSLTSNAFIIYSNGTEVFKINSSGAEIKGSVSASSGTIGGFAIGEESIYKGVTSMSDTTHNGVYVGTDGLNLGKGLFKVNQYGNVVASSVNLTGKINATSGTIGSGDNVFTIANGAIRNGMTSYSDTSHAGIYLGVDGIALGKGKFKVDSSGNLTANSGTFTGSTYASSIKSDGVNGYGGSFSGSGLLDSSVAYGKTGFKTTLNQVGTNKSDIASINNKFVTTLSVNSLAAPNLSFKGSNVSWITHYIDGVGTFRYMGTN